MGVFLYRPDEEIVFRGGGVGARVIDIVIVARVWVDRSRGGLTVGSLVEVSIVI